jgi:hypothetical protein
MVPAEGFKVAYEGHPFEVDDDVVLEAGRTDQSSGFRSIFLSALFLRPRTPPDFLPEQAHAAHKLKEM